MTPDGLAAVRERDIEAGSLDLWPLLQTPIDTTAADRRALLGHVAALEAEVERLRAALKGAAFWIDGDNPCWCDDVPDGNEPHQSQCVRARAALSPAAPERPTTAQNGP